MTAPADRPVEARASLDRSGGSDGAVLARELDGFAKTLDDGEVELLKRLFVAAMSPLERLRYLDQENLLSEQEWQALRGAPPS